MAMANLNTAVRGLGENLELEWRAHCVRLLPDLEGQTDLTEALTVAGIAGSVRLHAKVNKAIELRGMKFSSKRADDFAKLAAEIGPALQDLKVPSDVVEFLKGAAASGYPLNEFLDNDSIAGWLREKDLLGIFIVTTSSSQSM
jgi:hypothetical protein